MNIGRDYLGEQGDITEQLCDMQAPEPASLPWQIDGVVYPAVLDDWQTAEGIDKRYYAGLMAFLMRDPQNFDLSLPDGTSDAFTTRSGCFSRRSVSWDPQREILTVESGKSIDITRFAVDPEHAKKLGNKLFEVLLWNELNRMSDEELARAGYASETQDWGGYSRTWFESINPDAPRIIV